MLNIRCRYQSVTQQCLKRCLIKDDSYYMFRPIAAIIRFSSGSMVVVLYRIDTPPPVPLNNSIYQTSQMLRSHHRDITIPNL